ELPDLAREDEGPAAETAPPRTAVLLGVDIADVLTSAENPWGVKQPSAASLMNFQDLLKARKRATTWENVERILKGFIIHQQKAELRKAFATLANKDWPEIQKALGPEILEVQQGWKRRSWTDLRKTFDKFRNKDWSKLKAALDPDLQKVL